MIINAFRLYWSNDKREVSVTFYGFSSEKNQNLELWAKTIFVEGSNPEKIT